MGKWDPTYEENIARSDHVSEKWEKRCAEVEKDAEERPSRREAAKTEREARAERIRTRSGGSRRPGRGG